MPMGLKTAGIEDAKKQLALLDQAIRSEATRAAVREAAKPIRDQMKSSAPILDAKTAESTSLPPRAIKDGIRFTVRSVKDGVIVAVIGPRKGTRRAAHLVEFGHLLVKGGKVHVGASGPEGEGKIIGFVKHHPWLRPSFETTWMAAVETFQENLKQQLEKWVK